MEFFNFDSISKKLTLLVMIAVLPALFIPLYSGIEQRRQVIKSAKQNILLLTHNMAETQKEITSSTRQIFSTLSLLPAIQSMDLQASTEIFKAVLEQNPNYNNITLTDLNGEVLTSCKTFTRTNLADRKHFKEALEIKEFLVTLTEKFSQRLKISGYLQFFKLIVNPAQSLSVSLWIPF